jgi:hypothetical protein
LHRLDNAGKALQGELQTQKILSITSEQTLKATESEGYADEVKDEKEDETIIDEVRVWDV